MRVWRYLLILLPSFALAHGGTSPEVEAELERLRAVMVEQGLAEPVGTNDTAMMGLLADSLSDAELRGRELLAARFLAMRATPRSDGGMASRSSWVIDCATRELAIVDIAGFTAVTGEGEAISIQTWDEAEVMAGLRKPGEDKLGRKMVDASCAKIGR